MALDFKRLADSQNIPAAVGTIFANPAGKKSNVKLITIHNANTTSETVKLYRVPDSGGAEGTASDTGNRFFKQWLLADQTVLLEFQGQGMVLEDTNDTIQAVTDTASKVTISIDGSQE